MSEELSETEYLKISIKAFVDRLVQDGFSKGEVGAAIVGYGAGLVHHHSPDDMPGLISGIQDAIVLDKLPIQ